MTKFGGLDKGDVQIDSLKRALSQYTKMVQIL